MFERVCSEHNSQQFYSPSWIQPWRSIPLSYQSPFLVHTTRSVSRPTDNTQPSLNHTQHCLVFGRRRSKEHRRQIDRAVGGVWEKKVNGTQATDRPGDGVCVGEEGLRNTGDRSTGRWGVCGRRRSKEHRG